MNKILKIFLALVLTMFMAIEALPVNVICADDEVSVVETTEPAETKPEEDDDKIEEGSEVFEVPEEEDPIFVDEPVTEDPVEIDDPVEEVVTDDPVEEIDEETETAEEPEVTDEAAEEPEAEVDLVEQEGSYNGVTVRVSYEPDTFAAEVTLVVGEAGEAETAALTDAFGEDAYKAVDISFVDAEGNKVQPVEGKSVDVKLFAEGMDVSDYWALHVDEEGNIDTVDDASIVVTNTTKAPIEVFIPEMVEIPNYQEITTDVTIPAVMGTRTVEVTEEVTVPAEMGTRLVEKTREVEKTRLVRVAIDIVWWDPTTWLGYKLVWETYMATEIYYEEEEYIVTPEHTETVVVGTREEEYVITPEHVETVTYTVQVGSTWEETGNMISEITYVDVNDIEVGFEATTFSTYAVQTTGVVSGNQYVIYRDIAGNTDYALGHNLSRQEVSLSGNSPNQIVTSDTNDIKWLFEANGTDGYRISYSNNGTKTYLRGTAGGLTTTTTASDATTWSVNNNGTRIYASNGYIKYRNNEWTLQWGNQERDIRLATVQSGSGPYGGIRVHYVDASGQVIKTFETEDEGTLNYCDIGETISTSVSTSDHYATYNSGTLFDLVFEIEGYTYDSTYLSSYASADSHGDKINAEVLLNNANNYVYTYFGGDAQTSADDHTEDTHAFGTVQDIYVVYNKVTSGEGGSDDPSGGDDEIEAPHTSKEVTDNNDGTSTLSLSIAGSSKDVSKNSGANVVLIFDTSNSMNGSVNTGSGTSTRLAEAKKSARGVSTSLLNLNGTTPGDDPLVEMVLVTFNHDATPSSWYSTAGPNDANNTTNGFNGAINAQTTHQDTNWEAALGVALTTAQNHLASEAQRPGRSDPNSPDYQRVDDTYIIFVTDGQPSMKNGDSRYSTESTTSTFYTSSNYVRATDEARALVEAGYEFYSIGIYGTIEVLHYLTDFALTGRSTYDTSKGVTNNANGHFFNAGNADQLTSALGEIANSITGKLAVAGVSFTDGVATSVTSTNISASNASGFKYTVTNAGKMTIYEVLIDNDGNATFTFGEGSDYNGEVFEVASNASSTAGTGSDGTAYIATCETVTTTLDFTNPTTGETGTKTSINKVYTVKIGNDEYKMSPATVGPDPENPSKDGEVKWDLSGVGTIDSGYIWTVSFIIWPDQDAYDIVTDLNNGIETNYKWIDFDPTLDPETECAKASYKDGVFQYFYDGVFVKDNNGNWVKSRFTHIVKDANGLYSALTNTHQEVEYYIYDEENDSYIGPVETVMPPAEPISLDAALATVQKRWEVGLDKEQLVYGLYDTWTGEPTKMQVTMHVFEDGSDVQYTEKTLGWSDELNGYVWADEPEEFELYGRTYSVGTLWEDELSIAIGLMIAEEIAEKYGMDDDYPYAMVGDKKYYVLEIGHDYDITETGFQNYRFDYISKTYHPMLVDGQMYNLVDLEKQVDPETGKIVSITFDIMEPMSALVANNTLRGGINIMKEVVDSEGNPYDSTSLFTYNVNLQNETEGTFVGNDIPWYSLTNGATYSDGTPIYFYYHDEDDNVYQAAGVTYEEGNTHVTLTLYDAEGNSYEATSEDFKEEAGPATITYVKDGEEVSVQLYGNVLNTSADGKTATLTASITSGNMIRIANVPYKTFYTITEEEVKGFELDNVNQTIQVNDEDDNKLETILTNEVVEDDDVEAMKVRDESDNHLTGITDEIAPNRENNIKFTNKMTQEAFYVYHSSNNTVEKVLYADNRVIKEYDDDTDTTTYTFNIAHETLKGNLYGGYYKSYKNAGVTNDQITGKAESGNLEYVADTAGVKKTYVVNTHTGGLWAEDADGEPYDYAHVVKPVPKPGTTEFIWGTGTDVYTEKGTEMHPVTDTVYYLKEVPDHYDLPYTHYAYGKANKVLYNIWYITALDDLRYSEAGFVVTIYEKGRSASIVQTLTIENENGGGRVTLTPKSVFGGGTNNPYVQNGYLGYWEATDLIGEGVTSVFTPYWKTKDGVTVRGLKTRTVEFKNGKVGSGGLTIRNDDTLIEDLLEDIETEKGN